MSYLKYLIILIIFLSACVSEPSEDKTTSTTMEKVNRHAVIETVKGNITILLYEDKMPITTKNFIELAQEGFYDKLSFHRVVPGFVIQGGDPSGDGSGGSGKNVPFEQHFDLKHDKGMVGMARKPYDMNSATSQFYITLEAIHHLDGEYAVFGKVIDGMDVVGKIKQGDVMSKVRIIYPANTSSTA